MDVGALFAPRKPLEDLEAEVVRRHIARPGEVSPELVDGLRYVLNFAKLGPVRCANGDDIDVSEALVAHRWRVLSALEPHLQSGDPTLWGAVRELPGLVRDTRALRQGILGTTALDRESLEAEVTSRQLVVASGGGGGSGYGYAGAFRLLHRKGLQPEMLAGTSMGSLISMFRARHRVFDGATLVAAARQLSWNNIFRVLEMESRYGIPATLRLYLRAALGNLFQRPDGRATTFRDMEIPLLVVTTGITMDALRHDLSYYEHFMDDAVRPGVVFRTTQLRRLSRLVGVWKELLVRPDALRECIFGADELTMDADVLDAAGFSSAVTGVIHYDVIRDDLRAKSLLDRLYGEWGITRLTEGGLVNNVPARPLWTAAMQGRLGRRNPFVLALDCFLPQPSSLGWLPLQQAVRPNVKANLPFANYYFQLERRLSPLNLVPDVHSVVRAMRWTSDELEPHMPFIQEMCRPLRPLADGPGGGPA